MRTWVRLPSPPPKEIMFYIYLFSFFIFTLFSSQDEFKLKVEQFKYHCQTKHIDRMHESANDLFLLLQKYTKDGDNKSVNPVTIENLYTFVKLLGTKRHVPLYKDWLLLFRPGIQNLLRTREDIFQKIYPSLKTLRSLVRCGNLDNGVGSDKKVELNDEDLIQQSAVNIAQIHRWVLFGKNSKISGQLFDQKLAQSVEVLAGVFQQSQPVTSRAWCFASSVVAQHLFVIESTNSVKKDPKYYVFKSLYDVHVLPRFKDKNVMIPSSLLIPQIFQVSQFNKKNYVRSDNLALLIERVNAKLFSIYSTALKNGVEVVDEKMKAFVFQAALLNYYFMTFKPINQHGFKRVKSFEKTQLDLRLNLDEIFKLLKINQK